MTYALFNLSTKIYVPDTVVGTRDTSMKTNQPTSQQTNQTWSLPLWKFPAPTPFLDSLTKWTPFSFISRLGKKRAPLEQDEEGEQNL